MSTRSDEFSGLDDDDILVAASQTGPLDTDLDSPRPTKRRRLISGRARRESTSPRQVSGVGPTDCSDTELSCSVDDSPASRNKADDWIQQNGSPEVRSRHTKILQPKRIGMQENTFVSQLTQPPSSPSRIREPPAVDATEVIEVSETDEDIRTAIAASLVSFEVEKGAGFPTASASTSPKNMTSSGAHSQPAALQAEPQFDIGDIPEDAFDSSSQGSNTPSSRPIPVRSLPGVQPRPQQRNLRQTTLFDTAARDTSQSVARRYSPPCQEEPPTHHKLDQGAMKTWVYPTNLGKIREYQFNISQRALFHNLLVALPTGLGKTFIAATVMLNWFRWTKDAQIVFVAPTKPLVSQQVTACFGISGIPRFQTTMLTGGASPGIRAEEWKTKRVFFMTPQTLVNDLKTGIADPKRIVLLVVDEAHRATGGYAYVEIVKFLRRFNNSFRVLALTATPGSTVEAVQAVIDGLDIARVEIRTEQSLDIRDYVHSRNIDTQTFKYSDDMLLCMDLFSKALQPSVDDLHGLNAYWGRDPMSLTPYGLTKARQQWMGSPAGRNASMGLKFKVHALFNVLATLAHAMELLKYHGITPFYRHLVTFRSNTDGQKGGKYQRQILGDENFKELMDHIQPWICNEEFIGHPKLEYLKQVVLNHFMDAGEGIGHGESFSSNTRVMIFVHFRDSAEEVTRVLKRHQPLIRPHVFVGQASSKGSEGMDQKTQLSIVEQFKKGTFNTIVATSIGEEGLDIGEVDLIICYDSSASPIRMLQRMGRTGRKRAGNIVLLLVEGKEEESYIKAKDSYEKMQQLIASGTRFTFHTDRSHRIMPNDVRPDVDKRHIEIPPENLQQELPEPKKRARPPKRPPKKFHMPDGVDTGFTEASRLEPGLVKVSHKTPKNKREVRRVVTPEPVDLPPLEEVLLNTTQRRELEIRYRNIGGTSPQFVRPPRNDAFPCLQRVQRPTKSVPHGFVTHTMVNTLRKMSAVDENCEDRYRGILEYTLRMEATKLSASTKSCARTSPIKPVKTTEKQAVPRSSLTTAKSPEKGNLFMSPATSPTRENVLRSSPLMCSPPISEVQLETNPFYASQLTNTNEDMDIELPDINTILEGGASKRMPLKRKKRVIIDDESDF
ncbi:hypothetical protein V8E54_004164 [Elaphomyces granulatus]